jgi:hypothetical protein
MGELPAPASEDGYQTRLDRLVNEWELQKPVLAMARALDCRDWADYDALFTDNGVFEIGSWA